MILSGNRRMYEREIFTGFFAAKWAWRNIIWKSNGVSLIFFRDSQHIIRSLKMKLHLAYPVCLTVTNTWNIGIFTLMKLRYARKLSQGQLQLPSASTTLWTSQVNLCDLSFGTLISKGIAKKVLSVETNWSLAKADLIETWLMKNNGRIVPIKCPNSKILSNIQKTIKL